MTRWTEPRLKRLRELAKRGLSQVAAAKLMGVSSNSVNHASLHYRIQFSAGYRSWSASEERTLRDLTAKGMSDEQISGVLKRSREAVKRHRQKLRIGTPDTKIRKCLGCRKPFPAQRYIYMCPSCKTLESWRGSALI